MDRPWELYNKIWVEEKLSEEYVLKIGILRCFGVKISPFSFAELAIGKPMKRDEFSYQHRSKGLSIYWATTFFLFD